MLKIFKLHIVLILLLCMVLPISTVYAYTVDDVRDIVGKDRVDDIFTESEIAEIIDKYNEIERANLIAQMFEMGKVIDVDSESEKEYLALDKEINSLKEQLIVEFKSGNIVTEVMSTNTKLDSALHKLDSIKEKGVMIEVDYIENKWTDDYMKVQETVEKMEKDYEIGRLGEGLRSPVYGGFFITSPFGYRIDPITQTELTFHSGLDLSADLDEPILALWNGVVTGVYESETGGKTVEITHGEGLVTQYLHLNSINVNIGQSVRQYQVIAGAGSTGTRSTGVHLHLVVELDGEKVNPIYLFGNSGLNAFKTYLSYNPERNRDLYEVERNIKEKPTKEGEVVEEKRDRYERMEIENLDGIISSPEKNPIELKPYNPNDNEAIYNRYNTELNTNKEIKVEAVEDKENLDNEEDKE